MRLPEKVEALLRRIRLEMAAPPHRVSVRSVETSYADLERREIVLAEGQLAELEWVYRHEIVHLDKFPRTLARQLYWEAKIMNRLYPSARAFFLKKRQLAMNIAEDALVDYSLRKYRDAVRHIREYVENLSRVLRKDPPPHELSRMIVAGKVSNIVFQKLLEEEDVVELGVKATLWLMRHREYSMPLDARGRPSQRDYEEAAGELIREGEELTSLYELARDDGVSFDLDRAALIALVKSYDWYMSVLKKRGSFKSAKSRQAAWLPGDDYSKLDVNGSLTVFPRLIPGLTTVKREPRGLEGREEPLGFRDVALLVDESGSMRDKEKAVRRIGVNLLAYLNRRRIQYQIVSFGHTSRVEVGLGYDYTAGVNYFLKYSGWQNSTNLAPALGLIRGRELLAYILTDSEIHDLREVEKYSSTLREVVLVVVNQCRESIGKFAKAFKGVRVRGYYVPPSRAEDFIVVELGSLN